MDDGGLSQRGVRKEAGGAAVSALPPVHGDRRRPRGPFNAAAPQPKVRPSVQGTCSEKSEVPE